MLREPAASFNAFPPEENTNSNGYHEYNPLEGDAQRLHDVIHQHMDVAHAERIDQDSLPNEDRFILAQNDSLLLLTFTGTLRDDAEYVYIELDKALREWDMFALLRTNDNPNTPHMIHIAEFRPEKPQEIAPTWNIVLFIATLISVLITGTLIATGDIRLDNPGLADSINSSILNFVANMWRGIPYAAGILAILVPHEMGHYWMMRRHNTVASLPYFIPAPLISPFGTFGAAIALRESLRNRKQLLDVGIAGPLAGFIMAIPVLLVGLATSRVVPIAPNGFMEGNSLLYAGAKLLVFGEFLPNATHDVLVNQLAWAGWTGLFITMLNLLPIGQLDGGHIAYSLFGERARQLFLPLMGFMVALTLFVSGQWMIFLVLAFFIGRAYAVPLENITELDPNRRWLAWFGLAILALCFTPNPLYERGNTGGLLTGFVMNPIHMATFVSAAMVVLRVQWHRRIRKQRR